MAPPPSTPAPHRFLVPKRSATQRTETPRTQQFQATPRFSLHSTPRGTAASHESTPARPAAFLRQRNNDTISDVIDSSPPLPEQSCGLHDSIEVDSVRESSVIASSDHEALIDNSDDEDKEAPSPKRRRISISSYLMDDKASPAPLTQDPMEEDEEDNLEYADEDEFNDGDSDTLPASAVPSAQQPTFQKAPRFKPVELSGESHHEPLPDAFSPHRKGTKYVPGGLASQLRDWLIDMEPTVRQKKDDPWIAKILIDKLKKCPGTHLVDGQEIFLIDDAPSPAGSTRLRVILAGDGRLTGLARKSEVVEGAIVGIANPVWEVELESECWHVACDWAVL